MFRLMLGVFMVAAGMELAPGVAAWGDPVGSSDQAGESRAMLVMNGFPGSPDWYAPPVRALVEEGVIQKYGPEEWVAVVLSHEVHRHVGLYTIVGAKMGVHARELLEAPFRAVKVTLETGGNKLMTCAADGLQVALGSTYGQGLIAVVEPEKPTMAATFEHGGRRLRLALKPAYQERLEQIIADATAAHGFLTPAYFQEVEAQSFRVWAEFDRNTIFEATLESGAQSE